MDADRNRGRSHFHACSRRTVCMDRRRALHLGLWRRRALQSPSEFLVGHFSIERSRRAQESYGRLDRIRDDRVGRRFRGPAKYRRDIRLKRRSDSV